MGYTDLQVALKQGAICFEGDRNLVHQVPTWLYLNGEWRYGMGLVREALPDDHRSADKKTQP